MEDRKIIMYTMKSCGYCAQMKKALTEAGIEVEHRDKDEWKLEWEKVKSLTRSAVFPTFVIGKEYILPNRDFQNPNEAIQSLQYYKTAYQEDTTLTEVIEMVKNSIYMVKMVLEKVEGLSKRLDAMEEKKIGLDEKEKIRQQMVQRNMLIAEQRKRKQPVNTSEINKTSQKESQKILEDYVVRKNKNDKPPKWDL
tara:strand:+ start:203 stop:787 length:585 start_codon:yes stop_codon:yes gene_type:complete